MELETTEVNLGVRKVWDASPTVRPHLAGGLAWVSADLTLSLTVPPISTRESIDDDGFGAWIGGGVYWTLGEAFNIGLDLRYSHAEVSIAGVDANADGGHAGLLLGYHW